MYQTAILFNRIASDRTRDARRGLLVDGFNIYRGVASAAVPRRTP